MTTLTITHTHEAGTLIEGTSRGDGTAEILKAQRWRWGRSISSWYVPHSRDNLPKMYIVEPTKAALEAAGFVVELELDSSTRPTAEVEAGKRARQNDRVDALEQKADRKAAAAQAATDRATRDHQRLPWGGEPIKVGHHSEARHRRALERADESMRRRINADDDAHEAATRAHTAAKTTDLRYSPVTVATRIKKLQADSRRISRNIVADVYDNTKGYRPATTAEIEKRRINLTPRLAEITDQITYWEGVRADQIATEQVKDYGPDSFAVGDSVKVSGNWWVIVRVNKKTVSVEIPGGYSIRTEYTNITDHRAAA